MDLIGIPEAAEILGIDRTTAWRRFNDKTLIPEMVIGSGRRRRPLFKRTYIEAKATERETQQGTREAVA